MIFRRLAVRLVSTIAAASTLAFAPVARAEAPPSPAAPAVAHGFAFSLTPMVAAMKLESAAAYSPYMAFDLSPSYRFSRRFSLALHGTYGFGPGTTVTDFSLPPGSSRDFGVHHRFVRQSLEARLHAPLGDAVDAWVGGELGAFDGIYVVNGDTEHHFAPLVGAGAGLDFFAARALSLGFEARATAMPFGAAPADSFAVPYGTAVGVYGGVVLSLHLPTHD